MARDVRIISPGIGESRGLGRLFAAVDNLAATISARLEIDVMTALGFAGILVLDPVRSLKGIMRTAHAALRWGGFSLWNGHCRKSFIS
jgi:hypothetical protein